jgi:hypothetical protein
MKTDPQTIDLDMFDAVPLWITPTLWLLATFAPGPLKNGETHKAKNL